MSISGFNKIHTMKHVGQSCDSHRLFTGDGLPFSKERNESSERDQFAFDSPHCASFFPVIMDLCNIWNFPCMLKWHLMMIWFNMDNTLVSHLI